MDFFFLKNFPQVKVTGQNAALSIFHVSPSWQFDRPVIIQKHLSLTILEQSSETKQVTQKVLIKLGTGLYKPTKRSKLLERKSGRFKY